VPRFAGLISVALLSTTSVFAQLKVETFLGKSITTNSDVNISQPSHRNNLTFADVEFSDKSFEFPLYYGVRVGYFPPSVPFIGVELEFLHFKIYSDPEQIVKLVGERNGAPIDQTARLGNIVQEFSISHGANWLTVNIAGRYGLFHDENNPQGPASGIQLIGRIGIGPFIPHVESTIDSVHQEQYEINNPVFQLAFGGEVHLWWKIKLLLEYKFSYIKVRDADIPEGTANLTLRTHHFTWGVGVDF